jgi:hypothetical protein
LLLLQKRKPATLSETAPVWLPEKAVAEGRPVGWLGFLSLVLVAAKEISGEAACERAQHSAPTCACPAPGCRGKVVVSLLGPPGVGKPPHEEEKTPGKILEEMLENRYNSGINRCC